MKNLQVLTILTILTTTSGCSLFKNNLVEPLCLPDRPILEVISIEEQRAIKDQVGKDTLRKVGTNDQALKAWVSTVERLAEVHNEQFKSKCFNDSSLL